MAINPLISQLQLNSDFSKLDINKDNAGAIQNDDSLINVVGTKIQYLKADATNPTGMWVVNNQRASAGQIMLAQVFNGWLSANSTAQTQLSAMNVNTTLAKSASAFSKALANKIDASKPTDIFSYADIVTLASPYVEGTGMDVNQFVAKVLPKETGTNTYTTAELASLKETIDQYANARLTDNNVLQAKYENATSIINSSLEAMSNILKAWQTMLTSVGRNV